MSIFNAQDWFNLAHLFDASYAGFRPTVREAPNGDTTPCDECDAGLVETGDFDGVECTPCDACNGTGRVPNVDAEKRFLHVAPKYNPPPWAVAYLARAHYEACRVAEALGVPAEYYPRVADGTLRVLDYPSAAHRMTIMDQADGCNACGVANWADDDGKVIPGEVCPALAPGAGTVEHTDFDLFTVNLYRSHPDDHEQGALLKRDPSAPGVGPDFMCWQKGVQPYHIGELGELVGLGPATPHRVPARPYAQQSIVYFAMPDHGARLPGHGAEVRGEYGWTTDSQPTVGEWLKGRIARSRY